MKILIYTRSPEHGSSITRRHWTSALERNEMQSLDHELVFCHSEESLAAHMASADVIVSSRANLRDLISPTEVRPKLIFFAFAGVDHLAPFDWVPKGTYVVNNSGASGRAIGEYTIFALHLLANGVLGAKGAEFVASATDHGFAPLAGRSVTIIGAGGVGAAVAEMCKAFRMQVHGVRRSGRPERHFDTMSGASQLESAIGRSEFVVVACPVTAETRNLIDASVIARMKPGGFLVNVARGSIVDEDAVCDAVECGALGGAVLDVVRANASDTGARVRNTPGVLVTPHVSGDDEYHYIDNSLDVFLSNLTQVLDGKEPSNAVDFELGY